jgi:hypothetical protein
MEWVRQVIYEREERGIYDFGGKSKSEKAGRKT